MKRRRLGQHFLTSQNIAESIANAAKITKKETVFEIGTGRGVLIPYLCKKAGKVISAEADGELYSAALKFAKTKNLELIHGDGFECKVDFDVFVSNLPYSESKKAIEWLAQKRFSRAVIMVQAEFAEKIMSVGKKEMRAISVIANHAFNMQKVMSVGKNNFEPPPKVDSVVLFLEQKNVVSAKLIESIEKLFSHRRKTIGNILRKHGIIMQSDKRLEELSDSEIVEIAKQIV